MIIMLEIFFAGKSILLKREYGGIENTSTLEALSMTSRHVRGL